MFPGRWASAVWRFHPAYSLRVVEVAEVSPPLLVLVLVALVLVVVEAPQRPQVQRRWVPYRVLH